MLSATRTGLRFHAPLRRIFSAGCVAVMLASCGPTAEEVEVLQTDIAGEVDSALVADSQWSETLSALFEQTATFADGDCELEWNGEFSALGQLTEANSGTLRSAQVSARLAALDAVGADLMSADTIDEVGLAELRAQLASAPPLSGVEPLLLTRGLGYPRFEQGVFTPGSLQASLVLVDLETMAAVCGAEINVTNSPNAVVEAQAADAESFAASPSALLLADLYRVASAAVVLHPVTDAQ